MELALLIALKNNHPDAATAILQVDSFDVRAVSKEGKTGLEYAMLTGFFEIFYQSMYSAGADVMRLDADGNNLLMQAAFLGKHRILKFLIDSAHFDLNAVNHQNKTALHLCIESGFSECARLLCENGADMYKENMLQQNALQLAQSLGNSRVIDTLLDVEERLMDALSVLHTAARFDDPKCWDASIVLDYIPEINRKNVAGNTPLLVALQERNFHSFFALLDMAASRRIFIDFDVSNKSGDSILSLIVCHDDARDAIFRVLYRMASETDAASFTPDFLRFYLGLQKFALRILHEKEKKYNRVFYNYDESSMHNCSVVEKHASTLSAATFSITDGSKFIDIDENDEALNSIEKDIRAMLLRAIRKEVLDISVEKRTEKDLRVLSFLDGDDLVLISVDEAHFVPEAIPKDFCKAHLYRPVLMRCGDSFKIYGYINNIWDLREIKYSTVCDVLSFPDDANSVVLCKEDIPDAVRAALKPMHAWMCGYEFSLANGDSAAMMASLPIFNELRAACCAFRSYNPFSPWKEYMPLLVVSRQRADPSLVQGIEERVFRRILAMCYQSMESIEGDARVVLEAILISQLAEMRRAHNAPGDIHAIDSPTCVSGFYGRLRPFFAAHPDKKYYMEGDVLQVVQNIANRRALVVLNKHLQDQHGMNIAQTYRAATLFSASNDMAIMNLQPIADFISPENTIDSDVLQLCVVHRSALMSGMGGEQAVYNAIYSELCAQSMITNGPSLLQKILLEVLHISAKYYSCALFHESYNEAIVSQYQSRIKDDFVLAVRRRDFESFSTFSELGVDINAKYFDGESAIVYATSRGWIDVVRALLSLEGCQIPQPEISRSISNGRLAHRQSIVFDVLDFVFLQNESQLEKVAAEQSRLVIFSQAIYAQRVATMRADALQSRCRDFMRDIASDRVLSPILVQQIPIDTLLEGVCLAATSHKMSALSAIIRHGSATLLTIRTALQDLAVIDEVWFVIHRAFAEKQEAQEADPVFSPKRRRSSAGASV